MSFPIFGEPIANAVAQMERCLPEGALGALMADHHLGYSMPIGGVAAYRDCVSPSGVGYDIACGNKAVRLDLHYEEIKDRIPTIMDDIFRTISFGVGRKNKEPVDHELFESPTWREFDFLEELKPMAAEQLGTVGSGNHYVDLFRDEQNRIWIGVHFGSRGLGHKIATHFLKAAGSKDGIDAPPTLLCAVQPGIGQDYLECMHLAGSYAYAGRDWVCQRVADLLGAHILEKVHNHHNYAWRETHFGTDYWVVRKGATPAFPGQRGFVGGTMGDYSVILRGRDTHTNELTLRSTVHGAGRVMSRTQAAGKRRWKHGKRVQVTEGEVSREMMNDWLRRRGVELRGAGVDESPHCYKRIPEVLDAQGDSIEIEHTLIPLGVAMAGDNELDPYKD